MIESNACVRVAHERTLMMFILFHLLGNTLIFYLLDLVLPNLTIQGGWLAYVLAGVLLGLMNISVKPLLKILSFPIKIMTVGLFSIVINLCLLSLVIILLNALPFAHIHIVFSNVSEYLVTALVFSLINGIIHSLEKVA